MIKIYPSGGMIAIEGLNDNDKAKPRGSVEYETVGNSITLINTASNTPFISLTSYTQFRDADGNAFASIDDLKTYFDGFFNIAPGDGGGSPGIVTISDVVGLQSAINNKKDQYIAITLTQSAINGYLICGDGRVADTNDDSTGANILGIVELSAPASPGQVVNLVYSGDFLYPNNFTPGAPIFLNGKELSQTPPDFNIGYTRQVGVAKDSNTIVYINFSTIFN